MHAEEEIEQLKAELDAADARAQSLDAWRDAAVRVAEAALVQGDEDLGPALEQYARLRNHAPETAVAEQTPREESAERTADAAAAFLRSAQEPGRVQEQITVEVREAVEQWEQER